MKKLLVICGATATGKTRLALKLAKKFGGELLSADSRQVYRGMDIGTGKDLPKNAVLRRNWFGSFYDLDGVKVWGYDLADPRRSFSVAQYLKFAKKIINHIQNKGKLPILVGGTGFYIKGVLDGIPTAKVPQNKKLRDSFKGKKAEELFELLAGIDSLKAGSMNQSDRKNPRRLIRAIEIAEWRKKSRSKIKPENGGIAAEVDLLCLGLDLPRPELFQRIGKRVKNRIKQGIEKEIEELLQKGVKWNNQAMDSLGYKQWQDYFKGRKSKKEVITEWIKQEKDYAKRQIVWFKKERRIKWIDLQQPDWQKKVVKSVQKWYSSAKDAEKN